MTPISDSATADVNHFLPGKRIFSARVRFGGWNFAYTKGGYGFTYEPIQRPKQSASPLFISNHTMRKTMPRQPKHRRRANRRASHHHMFQSLEARTLLTTSVDHFAGVSSHEANQKFVEQSFHDLLARPADAGGLAYWVGKLDAGAAHREIAKALTHADEYFSTIIKPAYQNYLGRAPDDHGLDYWISQMRSGLTDEQLEASFIGSAEFYSHLGGTDIKWVDGMYADLLGRQADPAGEQYWTRQLAAGESRSDVAYGFAASLEREQQRIEGDYRHYLNRPADQQGLSFWVNQFAEGLTNEDLIAGFVGSSEYYAHAADSSIALSAQLADDTGISSSDQITSNPTMTGQIGDTTEVTSLTAGFDGAAASSYVNLLTDLQNDRSFSLTPAQLATIFGSPLTDGRHTLHLLSGDAAGNTVNLDLAFTLDSHPPTITLASPANNVTTTDNVTLTGQVTDAVAGVAGLAATVDAGLPATVTVDSSGNLHFTTQLATDGTADGPHVVHLVATDVAGNVSPPTDYHFTLQTANPAITMTNAASLTTNQNFAVSGQVTGPTSTSFTLEAAIDTGAFSSLVVDSAGRFSAPVSLALDGSADGGHTEHFKLLKPDSSIAGTADYSFTLDTRPPLVTVISPADNFVTGANITLTGQVTDATSGVAGVQASIDGAAFSTLTLDGQGHFSLPTTLPLDGTADGAHVVHLKATDTAGNTSAVSDFQFVLDTAPPAVTIDSPASGLTTNGNVTILGKVSDALSGVAGLEGTVDAGSFAPVTFDSSGNFTFTTALALNGTADGSHTVHFKATDNAGNTSPTTDLVFQLDTSVPPDPSQVAPPLDQTTTTDLAAATSFLYSGANPIQTGVAAGTILPTRAAVLRGEVLSLADQPLSGVTVNVLGHPEFGQTKSRADGMFDLAVNGGGLLTVVYAKAGFLEVQRQIDVPWQDYTMLPDVALSPLDGQVTTIDLSSPAPMQVAQGSVETDTDGTRHATVLFPQGVNASMTMPDGSTQPLTTLDVRATEYTVGDMGPMAMPGALPPTSGYTYAVELSVDQAMSAGATQVNFDEPLPFYVENFLNFPTGMAVPAGYYDRQQGLWIPSDNGRVIEILSVSAGEANLDTDGDRQPDDAATLGALGITDAERARLATLYQPGENLWRVPITHFTPWDCNWPYGPPAGARAPAFDPNSLNDGQQDDPNESCNASTINIENQTLSESIPITGTPFSLVYSSARVSGQTTDRMLTVPLTDQNPPSDLKRVDLTIDVAGREFTQSFSPGPNQGTTFTWDGLDSYGRAVEASQLVRIKIGYVYDAVYYDPANSGQAFGAFSGVPIQADRARQEFTLYQYIDSGVGALVANSLGFGGWAINAVNSYDPNDSYDPNGRILHLGNGSDRGSAISLAGVITTVAGNGSAGFSGDGGLATNAALNSRYGMGIATGRDGSLYIADSANYRVRRVNPDGIITTFAGNGTRGYSGDGGPATNAELAAPTSVAIGLDGSVYICDLFRVRRVSPDGIITTVAGNGNSGFSGDGGPATEAMISAGSCLAVGADGSLYIGNEGRIRRVSPNGIITTVAGGGDIFTDGVSATNAALGGVGGIAVGPDDSLYIVDVVENEYFGRIHRVTRDGIITTIAGRLVLPLTQLDGVPATQTNLIFPSGIAVANDGAIYFGENNGAVVRRVGTDGIITTVAGAFGQPPLGDGGPPTKASLISVLSVSIGADGGIFIADAGHERVREIVPAILGSVRGEVDIPSEDCAEIYRFDSTGRHLSTTDALTGAVIYTFGYNSAGLLVSITDGDNNVTTIERDSAGSATAIVSPYGQRTTLKVNADGTLASVTDPAHETTNMGYGQGGLLTSFAEPGQTPSAMTYDEQGRLVQDENAVGGFTKLSRTELGNGSYKVTTTDAENGTRQYIVERLPDGSERRTAIDGRGFATVTLIGTDGSQTTTLPDGTVTTVQYGPDPRFGMLAPVATTQTDVTPSGLRSTTTESRTATFSIPNDPTSPLATLTDTVVVDGDTFTTIYDAASHTLTSTSAEGRTTVTKVDDRGRAVEVDSPGVDPTYFTYDTHGRPSTIVQGSRTIAYGYTPIGLLGSITDPINRTTSLAYDDADRLVRQTQPDGSVISFSYDAAGNMVSLTPPGETARTFTYSDHNQLTSTTDPNAITGGDTTQYTYNLANQITEESLPGGIDISFAYCECGRLTEIDAPWGVYTYTYSDTTGVLSSLASPGGFQLTFGYDGILATSTTLTGPVSGSVSWTYDNHFRVASESVDGTNTVNFAYDHDGLLTQAGDLTLDRDAQTGFITGSSLGVVTDTIGYNNFGELASYQADIAQATAYQDAYTRDDLGRITRRVETIGGVTTTTDYGYALNGRLKTVPENGTLVHTYDYDANGNRKSLQTPSGTTSGTYDEQDRLLTYGTKSYSYTPAGYLQSVTDSATGETTRYVYDGFGNLTHVDLPGGRSIDYLIDGENRRVGKMVDGVLTEGLLYSGQLQPVALLAAAGNVVERFVYATGVNVPAYMIKGGVTYRLITDNLGSVRLVVDATTGAIAQRLDYDAFGNVLLDTNPDFQPFGFAGGLYDPDTGLVRFGARDYDAETGRWTAKDPQGISARLSNVYIYSENDPMDRVDNSGRESSDSWQVQIGAIFTAIKMSGLTTPESLAGPFAALSAFHLLPHGISEEQAHEYATELGIAKRDLLSQIEQMQAGIKALKQFEDTQFCISSKPMMDQADQLLETLESQLTEAQDRLSEVQYYLNNLNAISPVGEIS